MEQRTAAAILVVAPPDDPVECIAHDTGNGTKLPKKTVDVTTTSLKDGAEELLEDCPAVTEWEFTTCSEQYSYRYGLNYFGVNMAPVSYDVEMSAEQRAKKVDQDTTLTDF